MRGRRVAFIYPARSPREPRSCPLRPSSMAFSSFLPFLFSSSFLSFCHSRDSPLRARPIQLLSVSLSLSLFCLLLAILSSLLGVFSSNRKLLRRSINPSLFQRDDSKYTLTPLPFPVTFSFISWTRAAIFHPFDFHERHSLLICPSSCSLVFSLFLAGF